MLTRGRRFDCLDYIESRPLISGLTFAVWEKIVLRVVPFGSPRLVRRQNCFINMKCKLMRLADIGIVQDVF